MSPLFCGPLPPTAALAEKRRPSSATAAVIGHGQATGGKDHEHHWKRLRNRYSEVSRKVWSMWRNNVAAISAEWDEATDLSVGAGLIDALVEASAGRFTIGTVRSGPMTALVLRIRGDALRAIEDCNER